MTKSSNDKLRPHHSLCIQFFEGKGYSKEFTAAMTSIIAMLNESDPMLTLTEECDIICRSCPNNQNGLCKSHEKVSAIDKRCLAQYGMQFGDTVSWSTIRTLARETIIDRFQLASVCQNCEWHTLCFTKSKAKLSV